MSRSARQMLTLGVLVLVFGGLTLLFFMTQEEEYLPDEEDIVATVAAMPRLIDRTARELVQATFTKGDRSFTLLELESDDGDAIWVYEGNEDIILNQNAVRDMVRNVFILISQEQVLDQVTNPAEFGIGQLVATGYFYDGTQAVVRLGNLTPDHRHYYTMVDGDSGLHLLPTINGERMLQGVEDIVDRQLPFLDSQTLVELYIRERGRDALEFEFDGTEEVAMQFGGTWLTMMAPFPDRAINSAIFDGSIWQPFQDFMLTEVVELLPTNLARFGLDDPLLEFYVEDFFGDSVHLLFGNMHDDEQIYVKFGDRPHVFLGERRHIEGMLGINHFSLIDRFVALVPIVDTYRVVIESTTRGNHEIFINNYQDEEERDRIAPVIDGREVDDTAFRRLYQSMIGIMLDRAIGIQEVPARPDMTITYHMEDRNEPPIVVEFFELDSNFYMVRQQTEELQFVTSRLALESLFESMGNILAVQLYVG